jgi:hypothetical protein
MGGEEFEPRIRALPDDDAPPIVRLRRLLKILLRGYGFRCTSVRDVTPALPPLKTPCVAQGEPGCAVSTGRLRPAKRPEAICATGNGIPAKGGESRVAPVRAGDAGTVRRSLSNLDSCARAGGDAGPYAFAWLRGFPRGRAGVNNTAMNMHARPAREPA